MTYKPTRMCFCCRKTDDKEKFYRLATKDNEYKYDKDMIIQSRGIYICKSEDCIKKISKHKKIKVSAEELLKILSDYKKRKVSIKDILFGMRNSGYFVFGIEENIEAIRKNKVKLIILPKDIKESYYNQFFELKKDNSFSIIEIEERKDLIDIFSKNLNIVGIFDKAVVKGILKKMEVTD